MNRTKKNILVERDPLEYLNIYDTEDYYQQNPYIYPVPQTYATAYYAMKRRQLKEFTKPNTLASFYK